MAGAMESVRGVLHEVSTNHRTFCTRRGISEQEPEETTESATTTAYRAYTLDIGLQDDPIKSNAALAPCLPEYDEVGLMNRKAKTSQQLDNYG
jgi:hydroxymethylpyrimidine/phosphomethylpyrimidine kinase